MLNDVLFDAPQRYVAVFENLLEAYGPQGWWPADSEFEVMVGAILTQNTAWTNVEKAIHRLRQAELLSAKAIIEAEITQLANCLRPSGYFNVKAKRLRAYCQWFLDSGGLKGLLGQDTNTLRKDLLSVHGIGPETADDILLYALHRPVFVIDTYTRRVFTRLGLLQGESNYETLRLHVEKQLRGSPPATNNVCGLYQEYHALIVWHCKQHCRVKPDCQACPLIHDCHYTKLNHSEI